jgi:hypothetical protein
LLGEGCGSSSILNSGNVKCTVLDADSDIFVVDGVDGFGVWVLIHKVDPWPVSSSLCISAWSFLLNPFQAFLLSVPLDLAEVAEFPVSVVVASSA